MNFGHVFEQGDPVLIAVFFLLLGMSVTSWYIILWKAWALRREQHYLNSFRRRYVTAPDWPKHVTVHEASGSVALLIAETGKLNPILGTHCQPERKEILSMHLSQTLDIGRTSLDRGLTVLASIGSSAPFIGLFGTVWGIYVALAKIAAEGNANLNVVAGPMGEALIATAIGLFAAIPAVLAYNGFVRINRLLVQELRHIAEQLTTYLSLATKHDTSDNVKIVQGNR